MIDVPLSEVVAPPPMEVENQFRAECDAQRNAVVFMPIDLDGFATLEELADGDDRFLVDLLATYIHQARLLCRDAQAAARTGRTMDLIRAVDTLGGSSRNVGALNLGRLCSAIEHDAAIHGDALAFSGDLELISDAVEMACAALEDRILELRRHRRRMAS